MRKSFFQQFNFWKKKFKNSNFVIVAVCSKTGILSVLYKHLITIEYYIVFFVVGVFEAKVKILF